MRSNERGLHFIELSRVPFIVDSRPGYHRLGNQYIIDRAMGRWDPTFRGTRPACDLTDITLQNYANWLANFLEYAERRNISLIDCDYRVHLQGRYQGEMSRGIWSRDGRPLSAATVNLRVDQACAFLMWMEDKGYRPLFRVPVLTCHIRLGDRVSGYGYAVKEVQSRDGKVRQNKRTLRMPTNPEVLVWLEDVQSRSGYVMRLMCEVILLTGIRRRELACWRVDTLADEINLDFPTVWHVPNREMPEVDHTVAVQIKYGTKGPRQSAQAENGDKVGPMGNILIPLELARKLQNYKYKMRPAALLKRIKAAPTAQARKAFRDCPPVHLFLNEKDGKRITDKQIYTAWTEAKTPFKGWSPHLGRDFWACSVLVRELANDALVTKLGAKTPADYLKSTAIGIIQLQIMPQLRHASLTTSMIYLDWAVKRLSRGLTIQYEKDLDDIESFN